MMTDKKADAYVSGSRPVVADGSGHFTVHLTGVFSFLSFSTTLAAFFPYFHSLLNRDEADISNQLLAS